MHMAAGQIEKGVVFNANGGFLVKTIKLSR